MKNSKLNLIIDIIMLIVMMALIGVGLLNKYVLLSGQKKWEKYGENIEFTLFGFDRHDWNIIHFILGIILFGLLVLHIWFHWNMIVGIYQNLIKNKKVRIVSTIALLAVSIVLLVFSFLINATAEDPAYREERHFSESSRGYGEKMEERQQSLITETISVNDNSVYSDQSGNVTENLTESNLSVSRHEEEHHNIPSNIEVKGSMTLDEVATEYKVPVDHIKRKLVISLSTSDNERLGRLRKTYGFTMSEVEQIIYTYQKSKSNDPNTLYLSGRYLRHA